MKELEELEKLKKKATELQKKLSTLYLVYVPVKEKMDLINKLHVTFVVRETPIQIKRAKLMIEFLQKEINIIQCQQPMNNKK